MMQRTGTDASAAAPSTHRSGAADPTPSDFTVVFKHLMEDLRKEPSIAEQLDRCVDAGAALVLTGGLRFDP